MHPCSEKILENALFRFDFTYVDRTYSQFSVFQGNTPLIIIVKDTDVLGQK